MIGQDLREFIDAALDAGRLTGDDVTRLIAEVLPDGVRSRAQADALAALDRLVGARPAVWDDVFVDLFVQYVRLEAARAGEISHEAANWLMTSLDAGGVTDNGLRIAIEVSRAVVQVDQVLMTFALQSVQARRGAAALDAEPGGASAGSLPDLAQPACTRAA